jgi:hypothetical protein
MGFDALLKKKWIKKSNKPEPDIRIMKTEIGSRVIGNPSKYFEVELLHSQDRTPIFKSGKGTVELHMVRDTSNGEIHYRVLDTLYDNEGNIIESDFADNGEKGEKFSSIEDALEMALLDHRKPVLSGMGKKWTEESIGSVNKRKMFVMNNGNRLLYSVLDRNEDGEQSEKNFDDEDSAQDYFLS